MYLNDEIKYLLSNYEGVSIDSTICKIKGNLEKTIQICFNYHNIFVIVDFFEDKYNVVIYPSGISVEKFESLFVDYEYPEDFTLQKLIKDIDSQIKNHSKLRDTTIMKKKKKIFSLIARVSLCLPVIVFGSLGIYCVVTESSLKIDKWWAIFLILIPLVVWFVFDIKAKRLK